MEDSHIPFDCYEVTQFPSTAAESGSVPHNSAAEIHDRVIAFNVIVDIEEGTEGHRQRYNDKGMYGRRSAISGKHGEVQQGTKPTGITAHMNSGGTSMECVATPVMKPQKKPNADKDAAGQAEMV